MYILSISRWDDINDYNSDYSVLTVKLHIASSYLRVYPAQTHTHICFAYFFHFSSFVSLAIHIIQIHVYTYFFLYTHKALEFKPQLVIQYTRFQRNGRCPQLFSLLFEFECLWLLVVLSSYSFSSFIFFFFSFVVHFLFFS